MANEEEAARGCEEEGVLEFSDSSGGILKRCPKSMMIESSWVFEVLDWRYKVDELGILPNAGGWFDQSSYFVELIESAREAVNMKRRYK